MTNQNISENIIQMLGIESMSLEQRAKMVDEISQIVEVRVLERAYKLLNEDQKAQLDNLLTQDDPEPVMTFLDTNIPTIPTIFQEEISNIKQELVQKKGQIEARLKVEVEQAIKG